MDLCKKCYTMHMDAFDPQTFLWALEDCDVPYIPQEWNVLRDKAYKEKKGKMSGTAVMGKYLSKMHLTQFKQFTWADSEKILEQLKETAETRKEAQKQFEKELELATSNKAELITQLENSRVFFFYSLFHIIERSRRIKTAIRTSEINS